MAGKDGKLESKGGDVIRQGFMIKRSQNKKRFTPVNYKQRWFVLTKHYLIYYDGDGERRKERGRIAVESVHVVETASLGNGSTGGGGGVGDAAGGGDAGGGSGGIPSGLPFQVGYREAGQEYTLYLLATREQDRAEWIRAIRAVCSENSGLSGRYHAGLWSGKRWSCCRLSTRSAEGCDTCSSWSTKPTGNATNPSSTTTSASTTSISASGTTVCNNSIITSDHRSQSTQNAEANNNPIVQPQSRSTIEQLNKSRNGCSNYHVDQLIFYIYGQQQLKPLPAPNNNISNNSDDGSNNTHIEKLNKLNYLITPGIGAHKLHPRRVGWNKARRACIQEGGHLAIINSAAEEMILIRMLKDKDITDGWLGLHDLYEEDDWVTIFDESLESTGYTKWTTEWSNEPNNRDDDENCAILTSLGGMADVNCDYLYSFFCEISI